MYARYCFNFHKIKEVFLCYSLFHVLSNVSFQVNNDGDNNVDMNYELRQSSSSLQISSFSHKLHELNATSTLLKDVMNSAPSTIC